MEGERQASWMRDPRPRTIEGVEAPLSRSEVLRYLGYPADATPQRPVEELLERWMEEAVRCARPRATYRVLPVAALERRRVGLLTPGGITEFGGSVGRFLAGSRYVAAFIATSGSEIDRLAGDLGRSGKALEAMVVAAVGAERAEAVEHAVLEQLNERAEPDGFRTTLPYSPGYCGMLLTEQTGLFALFGDHTVGVTLSPECVMTPMRSVSGLIGLGPSSEIEDQGNACDRCEQVNCNMRR
ncbi:MAG: hypothetical protein GY711_32255 [bacterium]|nr:hypothetical protein [bacterium]